MLRWFVIEKEDFSSEQVNAGIPNLSQKFIYIFSSIKNDCF